MNNESADRRVRKTKRQLRQALLELMLRRGLSLNDISIRELTETADVNRGTFYLHYRDIHDLYDQLKDEMIGEFQAILDSHRSDRMKGDMRQLLCDAFQFISENSDLCLVLLRSGDTVFLSRLFEAIRPKARLEWEALFGRKGDHLYDYYYSFVTYGCVGLLREWLFSGMRETPQEMAAAAGKLVDSCMQHGL